MSDVNWLSLLATALNLLLLVLYIRSDTKNILSNHKLQKQVDHLERRVFTLEYEAKMYMSDDVED